MQKISSEFRSMKRLWQNKPDARGLLLRRDKEADFCQQGLEKHKQH